MAAKKHYLNGIEVSEYKTSFKVNGMSQVIFTAGPVDTQAIDGLINAVYDAVYGQAVEDAKQKVVETYAASIKDMLQTKS